MDVHLLVYDLSGGMARNLSVGLLGFQLDAVYHTSIMLNGLEYVYDGNIVAIKPGSSHLGPPLEQIYLGKTELPTEVIEEYIDSLREIYTVQAYNLWKHNCNNFSNDLATFLLGKGIPGHILNMPQAVLSSPLGQMLMPALEQQINANRQNGGILGIQGNAANASVKPRAELHHHRAAVREATSLQELDALLAGAARSCAVVFFTSATCPPCKTLYPLYDELAEEVGSRGVLVKVDTSRALDAASKYSVSATPTFVTFLHGRQENRWSGADPGALRGNVRLLVQMAWPAHPHQNMNLPHLADPGAKPVLFEKMPPLPKLLGKMGPAAQDESVREVARFLETRSQEGPAAAPLPDVGAFTAFLQKAIHDLPPEVLFAVVDLLRCGLVDPRLSGYLAEEHDHRTVTALLGHINGLAECPYALRLVSLQMACNLFSSPLYPDQVLAHDRLREGVTRLVSTSFLDDGHSSVRVAAAALLYNVALANSARRREGPGDALPEADQIELAASALEAVAQEEDSAEALEGMLLALGYLAYLMPLDGDLADLLRTLDARATILAKGARFKDVALVREVGEELLGKGLERPRQ